MNFTSKYTENVKHRKGRKKLIKGLCIDFLMALTCNLTSYAEYIRPNSKSEVEPNNTQETAQTTYPTYEVAERFAADDWSGRCSMYGTATSSDDDWYKVDLPAGTQYLSVVHSYGDNATYVEMFDSENNLIVPKKYGTRYNVTKFDSKGGTYYIHITGASENENKYTLFVGTPMLSSDEMWISYDSVKTSGIITKTFSLADEDILPEESVVARIMLRDFASLGYNTARVSCSTSPTSVTFNRKSFMKEVRSLGMELKSTWNIEFNPQTTVRSVPIVDIFYFYPVYDNTVYPHLPTIKK